MRTGESVAAEVDAPSVTDALVELEKQGLTISSIEVVSPEKVAADAELAVFYRELEQLLEHRSDWLPPLQSLAAELPHGSVRRQLENKCKRISRIATAKEFIEHRDAIALLPMIVPRFRSDPNPSIKARLANPIVSTVRVAISRYLKAFIYPTVLFGVSILAYRVPFDFCLSNIWFDFQEIAVRPSKSTRVMLWSSEQLTIRAFR